MNKHLKTLVTVLLAVVFAVIAVTALTACEKEGVFGKDDTMTLVIGTEEPVEYEIKLDGLSVECNLVDVLGAAKEQFGIEYVIADGMLSEVGKLKPDSTKGEYIYLFTTVEADFDVSEYVLKKTYKETALTSSGVGASDMTILAGCTVYIGTIVYG